TSDPVPCSYRVVMDHHNDHLPAARRTLHRCQWDLRVGLYGRRRSASKLSLCRLGLYRVAARRRGRPGARQLYHAASDIPSACRTGARTRGGANVTAGFFTCDADPSTRWLRSCYTACALGRTDRDHGFSPTLQPTQQCGNRPIDTIILEHGCTRTAGGPTDDPE